MVIVLSIVILIIFSIFVLRERKTIYTDLQYRLVSEQLFAFKNGKAFQGEAWSKDKKTFKIVFEKGVRSEMRYFHENGETFYYKLYRFPDGKDYLRHFYNEYGVPLNEEQANELYPDLIINLTEELGRLTEIINSHPHN